MIIIIKYIDIIDVVLKIPFQDKDFDVIKPNKAYCYLHNIFAA